MKWSVYLDKMYILCTYVFFVSLIVSIIGLQKTKYNILEDIGLLLVCVTLMVQGSGAANGSLKISDISTNTGNSKNIILYICNSIIIANNNFVLRVCI